MRGSLTMSVCLFLAAVQYVSKEDVSFFTEIVASGDAYRAVVEKQPQYGHGILKVFAGDNPQPILVFDPQFNHFIRAFPMDVTGDGEPEFISFWTHGVYDQVVIHTLEKNPKLLLQETYRYAAVFDLDPRELTQSLKLISSDGPSIRTVRVFTWSNSQSKFELVKATRVEGKEG